MTELSRRRFLQGTLNGGVVTVSLPSNKIFTTTNSSGAYTYSFNSTASDEYAGTDVWNYRDQNGFVPSTFCNFEHEDGSKTEPENLN